jgi:phage gpG-like protein
VASEKLFANPREFALFMERAAKVELFADTAARTGVALYFVKEARDRIGQAELLPPPLADSTQAERARKGYPSDATLLRTGRLRDSIKWEHESPRKTVFGSDDPKAPYHEFGTDRIPARSFLASTVREHDAPGFAIYVERFLKNFEPR